MGCCGDRRAALKPSPRPAPAPAPWSLPRARSAPPPTPDGEPLTLRYLDHAPVRVVGAASGRTYVFSATQAAQSVEGGDAAPLLALGCFRVV